MSRSAQAISQLRAAVSHSNDDTGILNGSGAPTVLNAPDTGVVWARNPAQVSTVIHSVRACLISFPASVNVYCCRPCLCKAHAGWLVFWNCASRRGSGAGLLRSVGGDVSRSDPACPLAAQIVQITTLANPEGVGGFFPTGYHGTVNGTRGSVGSAQYLPQ